MIIGLGMLLTACAINEPRVSFGKKCRERQQCCLLICLSYTIKKQV